MNGRSDVTAFYDAIGVHLGGRGTRNVMVKCFANPEAHSHGDKVKSCSVNLETGAWNCKACGAKGGPFDAAVSQGIEKGQAAELVKRAGLWQGEENVVDLDKRRRKKSEQKPTGAPKPEPSKPSEDFKATEDDVRRYRETLAKADKVRGRLRKLRGWTDEAMDIAELGWDGDRVVFPIRNATGELVGLVRYQPDKANLEAEAKSDDERYVRKSKADVGSKRELYPAPETIDTKDFLFVFEGEPDRVAGSSIPIPCVGYPGVGGWSAEWAVRFEGRKVCLVTDADAQGRAKTRIIAGELYGVAEEVRILDLHPERKDGSDFSDWVMETGATATPANAAGARTYLLDMAAKAPRYTRGATQAEPRTLGQVIATFQKWLYLPDVRPLLAIFGATAGNYLEGVPIWLLIVGPPGGGKTQTIETIRSLPAMHEVTTFTPASLLSGTSAKEKAKDATGGLLREMGRFGIVVSKDFTSTLSQHPVTRDEALSALREVYDGRYVRLVGSEGGRRLSWPSDAPTDRGKMGLIGGVTDVIDDAQKVTSAMGERLLLFRLEVAEHRRELGRAALVLGRKISERDEELAAAVKGLFAYGPPRDPEELTEEELDTVLNLSMLCAYCRAGVLRDRVTREIDVVYEPEVPTRLAQALAQLFYGLSAIGVPRQMAMSIIAKAAIDSAPSQRSAALSILVQRAGTSLTGQGEATTSDIAGELGHGDSKSTRRALEELAVHGVLEVEKGGEGRADTWRLSEWASEYARFAAGSSAGKVPEGAHERVRKAHAPQNALQRAISGGIRPAYEGTFPATYTMGAENGGAPNGASEPSSSSLPSYESELQDAGKVPAIPHGSKREEAEEASRQPSPQFEPSSWLEEEGWRLTDDEIDAELRSQGVDDGTIIALVDRAYDRRREEIERE